MIKYPPIIITLTMQQMINIVRLLSGTMIVALLHAIQLLTPKLRDILGIATNRRKGLR